MPIRYLRPLTLVSLFSLAGGCQQLASDHCGNNGGDSHCRSQDAGMYCSVCTLDNNGCVAELPDDPDCRSAGDDVAGSDSTGPSTMTTTMDGPPPGTDDDADTVDPDADTSSTTMDPPGPTTTGPIPTCEDEGNTCISAAPEGFEGPFAWLTEANNEDPAACPEPYGAVGTEAFSGLVAPAAECGCDCGGLVGASCTAGFVRRYTSSVCAGAIASSLTLPPGGDCATLLSSWPDSHYYEFIVPQLNGGSCNEEPSVVVTPAAYATREVACSAELDSSGCEATELCAPTPQDPFPSIWCVWADGDVECPADSAYTQKAVVHRSFDDGRACSECECELPSGPCSGASATLRTSSSCSGGFSAGILPTNGDCFDALSVGSINAVSYSDGDVPAGAECTGNNPVPTGQAVPSAPVTYCCSS